MAEEQAAPPIALAAIKYADLSNGLNKDYVFDIDRMVQTTGNTGPYLQYAHARLTQLLRRAEAEGCPLAEKIAVLDEPAEQTLALLLIRFGEVVAEVADTLQPHRLCAYLYEVAGALSVFYEQCPVLKSDGEVRASRLALCAATKSVLATGLGPARHRGPRPDVSRGALLHRVGLHLPVGGQPGGADDAGGVQQLGRHDLGLQLQLRQELLRLLADAAADHDQVRPEERLEPFVVALQPRHVLAVGQPELLLDLAAAWVSASWPSISMCPSSELGISTPR